MSEKTMFPREDHTEMLFQKILNDPWACDRLMETFNENLVYNDEFDVSLPAEKFAKALFNAYTNRDLYRNLSILDQKCLVHVTLLFWFYLLVLFIIYYF